MSVVVAPLPGRKAGLRGEISLPGDKSITHRAVMFGSFASGSSRVRTAVLGRDNWATVRIMRQLGAKVSGTLTAGQLKLAEEESPGGFTASAGDECELIIEGSGFRSLVQPDRELDCGNSGTTARLITGILAGRPFSSTLTGDESLVKRPFKRVREPLTQMGASFSGDFLPLTIQGGKLKGIEYSSPQASAQVKSAILLAGLQSEEAVTVIEPRKSRDHTERMLAAMGCSLACAALEDGAWKVCLDSGARSELNPLDITVPGDFSAAAFFLVAASIIPGSEVLIRNVGFNPTRIGLYELLIRMGADIRALNGREEGGEEVLDLFVRSAPLRGIEVSAEDVVRAIDEVPILAVAAAGAEGRTVIRGAGELRVKESDRLSMTYAMLSSFGCRAEELPDGLIIEGAQRTGGEQQEAPSAWPSAWKKSGDHRIAMSGAVMELAAFERYELLDIHAVETSFPTFNECFKTLIS